MSESAPTLIQSVQRALHLVEAVSARQGRARAKELARDLRLGLPTTYHLLRTLTHEGYLSKLDDGSYVVGPAFMRVATQDRMAGTVARARPVMQGLRDEWHSPVYLAAHVDGEITVVEIVDSAKSPSIDLWVGMNDSAHATALGKCILGSLEDEEREDYLARHPLHSLTRRTVTSRSALEGEIRASAGVARDHEEYALGVQCIAAPVITADFLGAVAVACRPDQIAGAKEMAIITALTRASRRIQRSIAITD